MRAYSGWSLISPVMYSHVSSLSPSTPLCICPLLAHGKISVNSSLPVGVLLLPMGIRDVGCVASRFPCASPLGELPCVASILLLPLAPGVGWVPLISSLLKRFVPFVSLLSTDSLSSLVLAWHFLPSFLGAVAYRSCCTLCDPSY